MRLLNPPFSVNPVSLTLVTILAGILLFRSHVPIFELIDVIEGLDAPPKVDGKGRAGAKA